MNCDAPPLPRSLQRTHERTGVGEAYIRAALSVKSDVGLIRLLEREGQNSMLLVMTAITTMDAEVAFRLVSVDLNYNKVPTLVPTLIYDLIQVYPA